MQSFVPAKFSPTKFVQKLGEISTCCSLSRCYFSSLNLCFDAFFLWTEKMSKNEIMYLGLQRGHFAWNFLEMAPKADTPFKLLMVKSDVTVSNHLNKILFDKVSFFFSIFDEIKVQLIRTEYMWNAWILFISLCLPWEGNDLFCS